MTQILKRSLLKIPDIPPDDANDNFFRGNVNVDAAYEDYDLISFTLAVCNHRCKCLYKLIYK